MTTLEDNALYTSRRGHHGEEEMFRSLAIKNLTDEEYFVPFDYFRGRVAPGEPRTVYGTITHRY